MTTALADHERLLLAMISDRDNWTLRSIYADALEEAGMPEAAAVRWMVKCRKRAWVSGWRATESDSDKSLSTIPFVVWSRLEYFARADSPKGWKDYATWLDAERAFHRAWLAAVADGWNPEGE